MPHVPGTVLLNDEAAHTEVAAGLKHGTGRNAHIVLAPQPSEDPNDPLNWPQWRKEFSAMVLLYGAMLNAATNGPLLNSSIVVIATELNESITNIAVLGGYNLLAAGCIGPFVCAFSRKWGKRPVFLWSTIMMIIGTAVGQAAKDYKTLLAGRVIQGFSTSAFESLIVAAVGDIYFVHQRGIRVALITFILNASSSLASIICGQITADLGWPWLFHILQIFVVVQFVLMFLFCPESTYIRDHAYDIDTVQDDKLEQLAETEHRRAGVQKEVGSEGMNVQHTTSTISTPPPPRKTFVQTLAVFTGKYTNDNLINLVIGPFVTLLNIGACWSTVTSGLLTMWYVTSAIMQAGIFAGPPWNFNAAQIGYLSTGPFVGGAVGSLIMIATSDPLAKWLTKLNKGIYEPEFRLVHMIGAVIGCAVGMFGYGHFVQVGASAYVCALFQGIMMCGVLIGTIAPVSYALDAYRDASNEIFIMNMFMKNFLFFGISYVANNWVVADGPLIVLSVCGASSVGIVCSPIILEL
jgi:MFS family permease